MMKFFFILCFFLIVNNCSLNKDSNYWTEDTKNKNINQRKLVEILKKSGDITTMSSEEYDIYIDDYIKKSKYLNINE